MVIGNKKTFLGYRCPHCGSGVLGLCGDFALAGGRMMKLKCPCGKSHLTAIGNGDGKVRLTLPCLLCQGEHHYLVAESVFYGRDLFLLNCAYSNLDICFIGEEAAVQKALSENEAELKRLFADAGLASLSKMHGTHADEGMLLPDTQVLDIIRFLIRELEADGQIDCPCHAGHYDVVLCEGGVQVFCEDCGGGYFFPVSSVEAAQDFIACDRLTLKAPEA